MSGLSRHPFYTTALNKETSAETISAETMSADRVNPLSRFLEGQGFVVLDGAMATELERHGADLNDPLWSARCLVEAPRLITRVHEDYLRAGADVISSATYQASEAGFRARGIDARRARELLGEGIRIACRARDDFWADPGSRNGRLKPLVAASMGPFGASLHDGSEYDGRYLAGWDEVERFHRERVSVLADAGADLLAFETIPSLPEAEVILDVLPTFPEQLAWISFSCGDEAHLSHGERFATAIAQIGQNPQLVASGLNCTAPRFVLPLLESASGAEVPLVAYPNSGETWEPDRNVWLGQGDGCFDPIAWYGAGARLIGGCCRTGPADIARTRASLAAMTPGVAKPAS